VSIKIVLSQIFNFNILQTFRGYMIFNSKLSTFVALSYLLASASISAVNFLDADDNVLLGDSCNNQTWAAKRWCYIEQQRRLTPQEKEEAVRAARQEELNSLFKQEHDDLARLILIHRLQANNQQLNNELDALRVTIYGERQGDL
jgi:hypothetical protein